MGAAGPWRAGETVATPEPQAQGHRSHRRGPVAQGSWHPHLGASTCEDRVSPNTHSPCRMTGPLQSPRMSGLAMPSRKVHRFPELI